MTRFLESNWIWILLIGGMLFMHLRHRHGGHMGGGMGGGCGGGHAEHADHDHAEDHHDAPGEDGHSPGHQTEPSVDDERSTTTGARRHGGC